jgi:YVTN family beta-propeller protein
MNQRKSWVRGLVLASASAAVLWGVTDQWTGTPALADEKHQWDDDDDDKHGRKAATRSSPIAITSDNKFVWSVNPDNDSVSVFRVAKDANKKIKEIDVGKEPWCVAIAPPDKDDDKWKWKKKKHHDDDDDEGIKVYVTNMVSGTVSVIEAEAKRKKFEAKVVKTIKVGTEPFGCALTPDGKKLYVTNQSSATVSVIDTKRDKVVETIKDVGTKPHGIAITADGKKIYVTQLLSERPADGDPRPLTVSEGTDDGRVGRVTVIDAHSYHVLKTVVLTPIPNTGFLSDGNTLQREPLTMTFDNVTGAFPNLLESIIVRGNLAYVSGTCSSPNGPFRFNVNVQSCLSVIDTVQDVEAFDFLPSGKTLNMNFGVQFEDVGKRLFNTNPFALAFKRKAAEGFVALGATDRLLRITLDSQGKPTINAPAMLGAPDTIIRIELKDPNEILDPDPDYKLGGKNPRGLVLNSKDTRAYVMDFLSRDIAVVDISGDDPAQYKTIARIQSADLPTDATGVIVQRGKVLFNSSIGPEGTQDNTKRPAGLMSDFGWGTCYSCHVNGLTDSVTWMFADGPRQAISMEATFNQADVQIVDGAPLLPESHQHVLNWSAIRDEGQDFTRNIRAVSGGGGLIKNGGAVPEGVAGLGQVPDFLPVANTGRSADLDAIITYLALGVRAPISPVKDNRHGVKKGRELFANAGCQNCHGGPTWTGSILSFKPPPTVGAVPPAVDAIVDAQLIAFLCKVGTFDPALFTAPGNEIRANNVANVQARGADGINVPSLISVFASAPYLHSGAAATLDAVLENVTHRSAGSGGVDTLTNANDRKLVVRFLKSIDRDTEPFPQVPLPVNVCGALQ